MQTTPEKLEPAQIWSDAPVSALSQAVEQVISPVVQQPKDAFGDNHNLNVTPTRNANG